LTDIRINPAAVSELAIYITAITKQNEHLRARVTELQAANNREIERRRAAEAERSSVENQLRVLLNTIKPEESDAKTVHREKEKEEANEL
jgi:hypothetical protein